MLKTLNAKTLYASRDGRSNLPYSSREIEVQKEKTVVEVPLPVSLLFPYIYLTTSSYMLFKLAAAYNVEQLSLIGVTLALERLHASFVGIPTNLSGL